LRPIDPGTPRVSTRLMRVRLFVIGHLMLVVIAIVGSV
jgi:hypothetical protein